jgi:hypothetical protein
MAFLSCRASSMLAMVTERATSCLLKRPAVCVWSAYLRRAEGGQGRCGCGRGGLALRPWLAGWLPAPLCGRCTFVWQGCPASRIPVLLS